MLNQKHLADNTWHITARARTPISLRHVDDLSISHEGPHKGPLRVTAKELDKKPLYQELAEARASRNGRH